MQLRGLLGQVAWAKAQFEQATHGFRSQLVAESTLRIRRVRLIPRVNWVRLRDPLRDWSNRMCPEGAVSATYVTPNAGLSRPIQFFLSA
jgi:hypothetical protein